LGTTAFADTTGIKLPSIFDDIDEDDQTLMDLYEKATGNNFRDTDRQFLNEVRHLGKDCITLTILMGRNRYRHKINSFRFFAGNIREVAAWQPDKILRELPFQWSTFKRRVR
jgi:hypothetical protein